MDEVGLKVVGRSRLYWTRPWGVTEQPDFLNAAVRVRTEGRPMEVLQRLLGIERSMGRRRGARDGERWGPRPIDLDLLLYGGVQWREAALTLPHPRIAGRDFVLAPLIDLGVAPDAGIAPRGWAALLSGLADADRTIVHCEPWT